jgi:hypothetical protein
MLRRLPVEGLFASGIAEPRELSVNLKLEEHRLGLSKG